MKNKNLIVVHLASNYQWAILMLLINASCVLNPLKHIISSLLNWKYAVFYFLLKFSGPLKKLSPLWNQKFLIFRSKFFLSKFFSLYFRGRRAGHEVSKSADCRGSLSSRINVLVKVVKIQTSIFQSFLICPIWLNFCILFQIFCLGL